MTTYESSTVPSETTEPKAFPFSDAESVIGITLIQKLTLLATQKWLILIITAIITAIGVVYSLILPLKYTATTKIMAPQQPQSSASLLMSQLATSGAASLAVSGAGLGVKGPNDLYVGLLTSRPIADAVIEKFHLMSIYHAKDMTTARKLLAEDTKIASEKSGFLAISVTGGSKVRAAEMANYYVTQLHELTKTLAVTEASQRRLFYEEQLKHANEDLVTAELAFQQIQQKKGVVELGAQARALIEGIASIRAQITTKEVELQSLRMYSTEDNPNVKLAESQLAALRQQVSQLERERHSPGSGTMGVQDVAGVGLDYARAQHELQYRQIVFDLLLKQLDAARLDEAKDSALIQVVEPAISPDQRSSPHRTLIVILFMAFGFAFSCVGVIMRDFVHQNPAIRRSFADLRTAIRTI